MTNAATDRYCVRNGEVVILVFCITLVSISSHYQTTNCSIALKRSSQFALINVYLLPARET